MTNIIDEIDDGKFPSKKFALFSREDIKYDVPKRNFWEISPEDVERKRVYETEQMIRNYLSEFPQSEAERAKLEQINRENKKDILRLRMLGYLE